jgi:hypothetical protein
VAVIRYGLRESLSRRSVVRGAAVADQRSKARRERVVCDGMGYEPTVSSRKGFSTLIEFDRAYMAVTMLSGTQSLRLEYAN